MKYIFSLAVVLMVLSSCKNSTNSYSFSKAEKAYEKNQTAENTQMLKDAYIAYAAEHPEDTNTIVERFHKMSDILMKNEQPEAAIEINELLVKDYFEHDSSVKTIENLMNAYEAFAYSNQDDEKAPAYLEKAAEMARSLGKPDKAISYYDLIFKKYPGTIYAPRALFLKAFTTESMLNNKKVAKNLYQMFINEFPDDEFADDAQFLLDNIDKTDEEILKSFDKK